MTLERDLDGAGDYVDGSGEMPEEIDGFRVGGAYAFRGNVMIPDSEGRRVAFYPHNRFMVVGFKPGENVDGAIVKVRPDFNGFYLYEFSTRNLVGCFPVVQYVAR